MSLSESVRSVVPRLALVGATMLGPQACSMRDPDDVAKIEDLEKKLAVKNDPKAATEVNAECADLEGKLRDCIDVVQKCKLKEIEGEVLKVAADDLLNAVDGALDEGSIGSLDICNANLEACRSERDVYKNGCATCRDDVRDMINKLATPSVR